MQQLGVLIGVQSAAKSVETCASDVRDEDEDEDEEDDDVKLQSSGVDPDRLKAFNVIQRVVQIKRHHFTELFACNK